MLCEMDEDMASYSTSTALCNGLSNNIDVSKPAQRPARLNLRILHLSRNLGQIFISIHTSQSSALKFILPSPSLSMRPRTFFTCFNMKRDIKGNKKHTFKTLVLAAKEQRTEASVVQSLTTLNQTLQDRGHAEMECKGLQCPAFAANSNPNHFQGTEYEGRIDSAKG